MRNNRRTVFLSVFALALAMTLCYSSSMVLAQPRPMSEDVFTPLKLGYGFMEKGDYKAAQEQFEKVVKMDTYNPYANNNLAAIMERQGKLQEALTYMHAAEKEVTKYPYRVSNQVCFTGGLCTAVMPEKEFTKPTGTSIAAVIGDNILKLQKKMGPNPADIPKDIPKMDKNKK
jgi:hypothetical protein